MFKKGGASISAELLKGLFGELYFLHTFFAYKYGRNEAVAGWSGADGTAKDFSIETDWYEVKTVSASAVSVKISSVSQLSPMLATDTCCAACPVQILPICLSA